MATKRHCCYINPSDHVSCPNPAEFEIVAVRAGGGIAGPDPYSDNTDACEAHVGPLLGHQDGAPDPDGIFWEVRSIGKDGV